MRTYTTPALPQPIEVTGHPRVTEGQLRLIHRQATLGPGDLTPVRSFRRADARDMVPGQVTEVVFDLPPTSSQFAAGHRIRLAFAGHDAANFLVPPPCPAAGLPDAPRFPPP